MTARNALLGAAVAAVTAIGVGVAVSGHDTPPPTVTAVQGGPPSAVQALAALPVHPPLDSPRYDRDAFRHWTDADRDGCDTRAETLERDALPGTAVRGRDGCVTGATVTDRYTGREVTERPGRDSDVDIDHVISLAAAWRTGAAGWPSERRERFANDLDVLAAVTDDVNRDKSDKDASAWLPPDPRARCGFAARQIQIKTEWTLWVTAAERDAMAAVLAGCPGQRLPGGAR